MMLTMKILDTTLYATANLPAIYSVRILDMVWELTLLDCLINYQTLIFVISKRYKQGRSQGGRARGPWALTEHLSLH